MGERAVTGLRGVVVETLLITPSGALSPGLLSAAAVAVGVGLGLRGGLAVALGHMLFELPYVALLVAWAGRLERLLRRAERPLAAVTAAVAAYFSYGLFTASIDLLKGGEASLGASPDSSPLSVSGAVAAGVLFTGLNPYFLAWWVTIGLPLVRGAARYGFKGFAAMYTSHVWMDYAWLSLLAVFGSAVTSASKSYGLLLLILGVVLVVFAADVALRAFTGRRILPF